MNYQQKSRTCTPTRLTPCMSVGRYDSSLYMLASVKFCPLSSVVSCFYIAHRVTVRYRLVLFVVAFILWRFFIVNFLLHFIGCLTCKRSNM